jgi:hypothetical protein
LIARAFARGAAVGVLALAGCHPAAASFGCESNSIQVPVELPRDPGGAVGISELEVTAWRSIEAGFLLENRAPKPIKYLTLVLQYFAEGSPPIPVVYEAAPDTGQPSSYLIPAQRVQRLPQPIRQGQGVWMFGDSPYKPAECPTSAKLTMLDVRYVDGSVFRWALPGWWTEPLLSDYPYCFSIPDSAAWMQGEYFFLVRVGSQGHVESVSRTPPTDSVPSESVPGDLGLLTFFPSLREGRPRDSEIVVDLVLGGPGIRSPTTENPTRTADLPGPLASALLYSPHPPGLQGPDWFLDFAGLLSYRTDHVARVPRNYPEGCASPASMSTGGRQ